MAGNFLKNFALEFDATFFYSYFLQIILVSYMYMSVGNGRYWKVLFYGSILGFFGAIMEHAFLAYQNLLPEEDKNTSNLSFLLLLAEIGWITTEFSVPVLNLIKLNSLSHKKLVKIINVTTIILFGGFTFFRIQIGYHRFTEHMVNCKRCDEYHSEAFGVMAITDTILSVMIFLRINKSSRQYKIKKNNENISILATFKKSSVFSLLIVDVISIFLSLTYIWESTKDYAKPFHALKSNFLLILAVDAFIFKFKANTSGGSTYRSYNNDMQSMQSNSNIGLQTMSNGGSNYNISKVGQKSVNGSNLKVVSSNPNLSNLSAVKNSNTNLSNYNAAMYSSQPSIPSVPSIPSIPYNKQFGLFNKNEFLKNKETQINIETPKPAATTNNDKYSPSPLVYGGNIVHDYSDSSINSNSSFHNVKPSMLKASRSHHNMNINNIYNY